MSEFYKKVWRTKMYKENKEYEDLNIEVESDTITWLRNGKVKLMGYENIDHLIDELQGIIEIDDDLNINLLDEEKLTKVIIFL